MINVVWYIGPRFSPVHFKFGAKAYQKSRKNRQVELECNWKDGLEFYGADAGEHFLYF